MSNHNLALVPSTFSTYGPRIIIDTIERAHRAVVESTALDSFVTRTLKNRMFQLSGQYLYRKPNRGELSICSKYCTESSCNLAAFLWDT